MEAGSKHVSDMKIPPNYPVPTLEELNKYIKYPNKPKKEQSASSALTER